MCCMYDSLCDVLFFSVLFFFFFKQKTAYEMRISDWSSDVCSSDLDALGNDARPHQLVAVLGVELAAARHADDAGGQHAQRDEHGDQHQHEEECFHGLRP